MKKNNLTIRIEPSFKEQSSNSFQSLGLDLNTATEMFYIQALRYHGLPFSVITDGETDQTTYIADPFASVDDLMEALDA